MITYYIGNTAVSEDFILTAIERLRHYWGVYRNVNLDNVDIIDDDTPTPTPTPSNTDFIRSGAEPVVAGTNTITFSTPLANALYVVHAWVVTSDGDMQNNLGQPSLTADGFTVGDVIGTGTLYYTAILKI